MRRAGFPKRFFVESITPNVYRTYTESSLKTVEKVDLPRPEPNATGFPNGFPADGFPLKACRKTDLHDENYLQVSGP